MTLLDQIPSAVEGDRLIDEDGRACIYMGLKAGYYVFQYALGQVKLAFDCRKSDHR